MTLNQVLNRIKTIALAHRQVRNFYKGLVSDFLNDHTTKYPSVFLQDNGGSISISKGTTVLSYKMFVLDLVHVSADTKTNEQDVHSDMISIAMDILAQMNNGNYDDWILGADNALQLVVEEDGDMVAGCVVDFSLSIIFNQDKCQIPSDLIISDPSTEDMKPVYDTKYVATGAEGDTLTSGGSTPMIPEIAGKKILFITRESAPIYKTSSNPDPAEYVWNNTDVLLGTVTNPGERFLILYRNY